MLKTNRDKIVKMSLIGEVSDSKNGRDYRVDVNDNAHILGTGGINYSVKIKSNVFGWAACHSEVGVSIKNVNADKNSSLVTFGCIGNEITIISGPCRDKKGYLSGKHGGIFNVFGIFPDDVLEKMYGNEKFLVKGYGCGLVFEDWPDIEITNVCPDLLDKIEIEENNGYIVVPAVTKIPSYLMGSGVGSGRHFASDVDLQTSDWGTIEKLGLTNLRIGDFVVIDDYYKCGYYKGGKTWGIVVHADSPKVGHGPGITVLLTTKYPIIQEKIEDINLGDLM